MRNKIEIYTRLLMVCMLIILIVTQTSCKKYLDKKPSQNLAVPSSLADLQAVLDNQTANSHSPNFLEFIADNYYLTTDSWNNLDLDLRKNYRWDNDARITIENSVWTNPYQAIYYANFVLDFLPKIKFDESDRSTYNNIKGTALFYRAFLFHQLAQLFCKPYSASASADPGIVLRTTSTIETQVTRSTVQQTYDQVIADLKIASDLLPAFNSFSTRPNKATAYGSLARVYLSMRDYANAAFYADAALNLNNTLLDYNSLTLVNNAPVLPVNFLSNPEVLYQSYTTNDVFSSSHKAIVDSFLYQSYNANDLRRSVFFGSDIGSTHYWRGSYQSTGEDYSIFDGIATDEIYLIRAESRARTGNVAGAMADLDTLLSKRWVKGTFVNLSATNSTDALNKILPERRKELLFRGLRWSDLRRFNLEGTNITLTRILGGSPYTLPYNDNFRWVLLIPDLEISRSGISQNPRQ